MITKEELRDWLDEDAREKRYEEIEKYIDKKAKEEILSGKRTFYISTGRVGNGSDERTEFYKLWCSPDLSVASANKVRNKILKAYRDQGFDVDEVNVDCGWGSLYKAVRFENVHKVLEGK